MDGKRAMKASEVNQTCLVACSDYHLQSYSLVILIVCHKEHSFIISFQVLQNTYSKMELEMQVIYRGQCLCELTGEVMVGNAAV